MSAEKLTICDADDNEVVIPSKYVVCPRCNGKGTHTNPSIDGNGITQSEFAEWDEDQREMYFSGGYDVVCENCHGDRVVLEADYDAMSAEQKQMWETHVRDAAEYRALVRAERQFGC